MGVVYRGSWRDMAVAIKLFKASGTPCDMAEVLNDIDKEASSLQAVLP